MQEVRWLQRYENFQKSIVNLEDTKKCIEKMV